MSNAPIWNPVRQHPLGFLSGLNENMVKMDRRQPGWLADVRCGTELLVATDYAGEKLTYQVLSFILLHLPGNEQWDSSRNDFRKEWLPDGREIKYSALSENSFERKALPAFLAAADSIRGISITFLLNKNIQSVIADRGRTFLKNSLPDFTDWKIEPFEKLFRIAHFLGFLVAGLSGPDQNVWWLTDRDEIVANDARLSAVTKLVAAVTEGFLTHRLGVLRCGTNALDTGTAHAKDLTSIPDLVAGALGEAWNQSSNDGTLPGGGQTSGLSPKIAPKAQEILSWLSRKDKALKRLVCVLDARSDAGDPVIDFHWPEFRSG